MGRRPLVGMVLAWLAVVLVVATVTFLVVDRAGRGVGQASAAGTIAPVPTASTSTTPGMPGTATPTASPSTDLPAPTGSPAAPRTASFPTAGGTVVASCDGATIILGSITVRDGWRFEDEAERNEIEVKFKAGADDLDDVELVLGCVNGIPTALED